jgi:predicted AlkP superfamily phosphohydrolase/phosphomutase
LARGVQTFIDFSPEVLHAMATALGPRKVLFLEFNELTWTILDPLIEQGKLPNFARLRREGTTAAPEANERPPHLDPWISWVTLHTGVDRLVHGAAVLGQDDSTIRARRTWDYVVEAGKTIGIFGSISSYPPHPVPGFMVPGPFSPTSDTYPQYISPALDLNRKYTQVHHKNEKTESLLDMIRRGKDLFDLGLKPATVARVAAQLARERFEPHTLWKRVSVQPLINYDFFSTLYKRYQPDYATWHTGHCAHYMHHYWRAWNDQGFTTPAPAEEKRKYGKAIEYGYGIADELLGRFMKLAGPDTIVVLASGLGMKPYVAELYPEGKIVVRMKDVHQILRMLGATGVTEVVPTMIPQWNIKIPSENERARVKGLFEKAYVQGGAKPSAFSVVETGEILTVTPYGIAKREGEIRYFFPDAPNAKPQGYVIDELFAVDTPTPKESMHDPAGVLLIHGRGIQPGLRIPSTTNLDIAPTLLTMMGIPVPAQMKGRVLSETWGEKSTPSSTVSNQARA